MFGSAARRWCGENIIARYQMTVLVEALCSRNPLLEDNRRCFFAGVRELSGLTPVVVQFDFREVKMSIEKRDHNTNNRDSNAMSSELLWVFMGGGIAIVVLLIASVWWPNLSERTKFFTGNFLNLIVALAVIAQGLIYRKQWAVMERGLRVQARAYVGVHSIETEWNAERIAITIENTGHVPAEDIKATIELRAMIPKQWLQPNEEELSVRQVEHDFGHTKLFPGSLKIRTYAYLDRVPTKYHPLFVQGRGTMIIRCWISYGDGFGKSETTEAAFYYIKDEGTKEGQWYTFPVRSTDEWVKMQTVKTHSPHVAITERDQPVR